MKFKTICGDSAITGDFPQENCRIAAEHPQTGVEIIRLRLNRMPGDGATTLRIAWKIPQLGIFFRWYPALRPDRSLPPDWDSEVKFSCGDFMPLLALLGEGSVNKLTFAVFEPVFNVKLGAGVIEENSSIACSAEITLPPTDDAVTYNTALRIDVTNGHYAPRVIAAAAWMTPHAEPPESAWDAVYSTWYAFHQNLTDSKLRRAAADAAGYGLKTLIVDDGWQTDDNRRGYAFCGDWEVAKSRFPDMRTHVAAIHQLKMKYLLWFALPLVGCHSKAARKFQGKMLRTQGDGDRRYSVLDPRFQEVREYLAGLLESAVRDWDIDGFKIDFIDSLIPLKSDLESAVPDRPTIGEALKLLLDDIRRRCAAVKPGLLFEFRQRYIGAALRDCGNMLRAADCPGDILGNRVRTIDLRLVANGLAVHSDMLEWNPSERVEDAALQLLNVIFAVPQISVRFEALPEKHRKMLAFWLGFATREHDLLLKGQFFPDRPEANYPKVTVRVENRELVALYAPDLVTDVTGPLVFIVNATGAIRQTLRFASPMRCRSFFATGEPAGEITYQSGLQSVAIPPSGLGVLTCEV